MLQSIWFELSKCCERQVSSSANFCYTNHNHNIKRVKQDVDAHYLFLTQNLALKAQLGATTLQNFPKSISYVYSYSAAQNIMER